MSQDTSAINRYASEHPDLVVAMRVLHDPPATLILIAGSDLDHHEAALQALVATSGRLIVERGPRRSQLNAIRDEIGELAMAPSGRISTWGVGWGVVTARLGADQEALAARLVAKHGDAVSLTVGFLPYPSDRPLQWAEELPRDRLPSSESVTIAGLEVSVEIDEPEIRSGCDSRGRVVLRNVGQTDLEVETEQPLLAVIVDPVTLTDIGGVCGNVAGTGLSVRLQPGGEQAVLLLVGSAGMSAAVGYAVPPGHYLVRAVLPVYERTDQTVTRRVVPTPLTGITLLVQ